MARLSNNRGKDALVALEREARSLDPDPADTPSYFELLANSVRVLREGSYALIGADAAHKAFAGKGRRVFWTPAGAGASSSDDFGYTYGRYARFVGTAEEGSGYYVTSGSAMTRRCGGSRSRYCSRRSDYPICSSLPWSSSHRASARASCQLRSPWRSSMVIKLSLLLSA